MLENYYQPGDLEQKIGDFVAYYNHLRYHESIGKRQRWVKQADASKQLVEAFKRVKRWWRTDSAGYCFFILRYGNKLVPISDGKSAVAVGERAKLAAVIETVIAVARDGELYVAIEGAKGVDIYDLARHPVS